MSKAGYKRLGALSEKRMSVIGSWRRFSTQFPIGLIHNLFLVTILIRYKEILNKPSYSLCYWRRWGNKVSL